jgi:hypothetical protein
LTATAITHISVAAASQRTGLAEKTLRNYVWSGKLTKYRIGQTRRIVLDVAEVDALIPVTAARKTA